MAEMAGIQESGTANVTIAPHAHAMTARMFQPRRFLAHANPPRAIWHIVAWVPRDPFPESLLINLFHVAWTTHPGCLVLPRPAWCTRSYGLPLPLFSIGVRRGW
jgi:hypothetical protein